AFAAFRSSPTPCSCSVCACLWAAPELLKLSKWFAAVSAAAVAATRDSCYLDLVILVFFCFAPGPPVLIPVVAR
ncbi:hypothetical protein U1Q18_024683, partial [Sarracenia purpurea var. burkii]